MNEMSAAISQILRVQKLVQQYLVQLPPSSQQPQIESTTTTTTPNQPMAMMTTAKRKKHLRMRTTTMVPKTKRDDAIPAEEHDSQQQQQDKEEANGRFVLFFIREPIGRKWNGLPHFTNPTSKPELQSAEPAKKRPSRFGWTHVTESGTNVSTLGSHRLVKSVETLKLLVNAAITLLLS